MASEVRGALRLLLCFALAPIVLAVLVAAAVLVVAWLFITGKVKFPVVRDDFPTTGIMT